MLSLRNKTEEWRITYTGPCAREGCHEYACGWSWRFHGASRGNPAVAWHCHSNGEWWRCQRGSWEMPRSRRGGLPRTSPRRQSRASGHCWASWPGRPAPPRNAAHWAGTAGGRKTHLSGSRNHPACTWPWKIRRCCGYCRKQEAPLMSFRNFGVLRKMDGATFPASEIYTVKHKKSQKRRKLSPETD